MVHGGGGGGGYCCRLCLTATVELSSFYTKDVDGTVLIDKLMACVPQVLVDDENLPTFLCANCITELNLVYGFHQKCNRSYNLLKSTVRLDVQESARTTVDSDGAALDKHEKHAPFVIVDDSNSVALTAISGGDSCDVAATQPDDLSVNDDLVDYDSIMALLVATNCDHRPAGESCIPSNASSELLRPQIANTSRNVIDNRVVRRRTTPTTYRPRIDVLLQQQSSIYLSRIIERCKRVQRRFVCATCATSYATKRALIVHVRQHAAHKAFTCHLCPYRCAWPSSLERHHRLHVAFANSPQLTCTECREQLPTRYTLMRHFIDCHRRILLGAGGCTVHRGAPIDYAAATGRALRCAACNRYFLVGAEYEAHMRRHHSTTGTTSPSSRPHRCRYCPKAYANRSCLYAHQRTHTAERRHVCPVCAKRFLTGAGLQRHHNTHTGRKPFTCTVCDRALATYTALKSHRMIHTGEKPYACSVCGRHFRQPAQLKRHAHTMHKHNTTAAAAAAEGRRRDVVAQSRRPQQRISANRSDHRCNVCSKVYRHAHSLRAHKNSHKAVKPYGCEVCERRFTYRDNLVSHRRCFHDAADKNGGRNDCAICGKVFATAVGSRRHLQAHWRRGEYSYSTVDGATPPPPPLQSSSSVVCSY